jgi:hypothetical protein
MASDELETTSRSTGSDMLTISRRIQAFHGTAHLGDHLILSGELGLQFLGLGQQLLLPLAGTLAPDVRVRTTGI